MKKVINNYPGSKGSPGTHQKIINEMPPHDVYIETHLGGGYVFLKKAPAKLNYGIDKDSSVISSWKTLESFKGKESVFFINDDAVDWLKKYEKKTGFKGCELIYVDPPYLHETRRDKKLYQYEYSDRDHEKLLDYLVTLPCYVILSGYESELYNKKLSSWRTVQFDSMTRQGLRTETLWMNFEEPEILHDYNFFGENFRERERIKRKAIRWYERFQRLEPKERQAINAIIRGIELPKGKPGPKFSPDKGNG